MLEARNTPDLFSFWGILVGFPESCGCPRILGGKCFSINVLQILGENYQSMTMEQKEKSISP
jgi:hypothetical protein